MIVRVLAGGDHDQVVKALKRALADPDVQSVVIHKPGSQVRLHDGREAVVTATGELVAVR